MTKFFICYSRKVQGEVTRLAQELELLELSAWFDQKLSGGQAWWNEILAKIRACDFFVVALAPDTLDSQAAKREWDYASSLNKTILPVLLADGVSDRLLPPVLTRIQYVDYRKADRQAAFALVKAINSLPRSAELPNELPDPPEVPISYLSSIKDRVESPGTLDYDEQIALVLRLQEGAENQEEAADILAVLHRFKQRGDLLAKTDKHIDGLIERIGNQGSWKPPEPDDVAVVEPPSPPVPPVPPSTPTPPEGKVYAEGKNPVASLIMSLFIVGLGQFYNGDIKKGVLMLAGAIVGGPLTFGILWIALAIWSAIDAYQVADRNASLWT